MRSTSASCRCAAAIRSCNSALQKIDREHKLVLLSTQTKAASAELGVFLRAIGLADWERGLRKLGFSSILVLKTEMQNGRNVFFGRLEDVGLILDTDRERRPQVFKQKLALITALEAARVTRPARTLSEAQLVARKAALDGRTRHEALLKEQAREQAQKVAIKDAQSGSDDAERDESGHEHRSNNEGSTGGGWRDHHGHPCDDGEVERVLEERVREQEGATKEYLVHWAWGTHFDGDGRPVEKSWVAAHMLDAMEAGTAEHVRVAPAL
eukprot:SAG11_NODE_737_length_7431_cov_7.438762_8_plen_268_part_00